MKTINAIFHFFHALSLEEVLVSVFFLFYLSEWLLGKLKGIKTHEKNDTIQNFLIGFFSFLFDFLFSMLTLPFLSWLFHHCSLFTFNNHNRPVIILLFILVDLSEYWFHRLSHEINILWSAHIVHHQSECFNLSVGLRTSLFVPFFNIFIYALFPLLGFDPELVLLVIFVQGIYQLLVHTELIGKLGILEYIIVTPSGHRVHHGRNELYIDKNYGKFFIIWDLIFGTYQKETEQVNYGIQGESGKRGAVQSVFGPYIALVAFLRREKKREKRKRMLFGKPAEVKSLVDERSER